MHIPVLLNELIYYLNPKPGDVILDCTIGGGGHAEVILKAIGNEGKLIGIDQDDGNINQLKEKKWENVDLINGNFGDADWLLKNSGIAEIDGAIFDLGLNSLQIDESGRGFTFQKDEPLLMTFKKETVTNDLTAREIVNSWSEKEIADILFKYGEERFSRRIAKKIVEIRKKNPIITTFDLVEAIRMSVPVSYRNNRRTNCCTKTFPALRIAVNDELSILEKGLGRVWNLLKKDGRIVVISFHSLEDRIVKNYFRNKSHAGFGKILTKKPIVPTDEENAINPRARSSKLRAIEKATSSQT